jgi:hypothetical protein
MVLCDFQAKVSNETVLTLSNAQNDSHRAYALSIWRMALHIDTNLTLGKCRMTLTLL